MEIAVETDSQTVREKEERQNIGREKEGRGGTTTMTTMPTQLGSCCDGEMMMMMSLR